MIQALELLTRAGRLKIVELIDGEVDRCVGCQKTIGSTDSVRIEVVVTGHAAGEGEAALGVCGDCLAEAVAILLGRRHVQTGGTVEDLELPPSTTDTVEAIAGAAGVCPSCESGDHVMPRDDLDGVHPGDWPLKCARCGSSWTGRRTVIRPDSG